MRYLDKKKDLPFILLALLFVSILITVRIVRERTIEEKKAYVVATIKHTEWLANGFLYDCEYQYGNKIYKARFSDIRQKADSLVFLKISKHNPENWIWLQAEVVPKCITTKNVPEYGWDTLPKCLN